MDMSLFIPAIFSTHLPRISSNIFYAFFPSTVSSTDGEPVMSFLHQRLSAEQQVLPYVQQAAISVMTWLWLTNGALLFLALKARCSSNWPITLTDSFIRHQPDTAAMQCGVETIAGGCLLTRIARHRTHVPQLASSIS